MMMQLCLDGSVEVPRENTLSWRQFYHRHLRSPGYRAFIRDLKVNRAKNRCERCGHPHKALDGHHKHYRTLGNERPEDIEILCPSCHVIADAEREGETRMNREDKRWYRRVCGYGRSVYGDDWERHVPFEHVESELMEFADREDGYY